MAGRGQDLFNAGVLSLTVVMVAWTIAWMRKHGAVMAVEARDAGARIRSGQAPLYLLAVTIGVAGCATVGAGGVSVGALPSGPTSQPGILGEFIVGGGAGAVIGALIYYGVLRAGIKSVFQLAAVLLAMLGAGLAAQAAGFLVSAGWLPPLIDPIWDSSMLLPDESALGQLAHALFGYISQPSAVQVAIYAAVLAAICWLGLRAPARRQRQPAG